MATIQQNLTSNQSITITLASLANAATVLSSAIDNSSTLYIGADVQIKFKTGAAVSGSGTLDVYMVRSLDGTGTLYDDGVAATATLIDNFPATVSATTQVVSMSIEVLPSRWKLMVVNSTGDALDASGANFSVIFEGKKLSTV
jgi:hypothetical protein